jgi:hypothetical protein
VKHTAKHQLLFDFHFSYGNTLSVGYWNKTCAWLSLNNSPWRKTLPEVDDPIKWTFTGYQTALP